MYQTQRADFIISSKQNFFTDRFFNVKNKAENRNGNMNRILFRRIFSKHQSLQIAYLIMCLIDFRFFVDWCKFSFLLIALQQSLNLSWNLFTEPWWALKRYGEKAFYSCFCFLLYFDIKKLVSKEVLCCEAIMRSTLCVWYLYIQRLFKYFFKSQNNSI